MGTLANLKESDAKKPRRGLRALLWLAGIVGGAALVIVAAYNFDMFTESGAFCGQLCHPNRPEYVTHLVSPHANVECGICHVGPGLLPKVTAKIRGVGELVSLITNSYGRPIEAPVESLPSTKAMCEQCHSRGKAYPDRALVVSTFAQDETNSQTQTQFTVKIGAPTVLSEQDVANSGAGAHWHIANPVEYVARGVAKQDIPWVSVTKADQTVVYQATSDALSTQELATLARQQMTCLDCHSRPAHQFRPPETLLDEAIAAGRIDRTLPYVKREGAKLLAATYATQDAGVQAMTALETFYQSQYPAVYAANSGGVEQAVNELQAIQRRSLFPDMQVTATTYPNNLGHVETAGCFRCHDGQHVSAKKESIPATCTLCHSLPVVVRGGKTLSQAESLAASLPPAGAGTTIPKIPHAVKTAVDCLSCHGQGAAKSPPASHKGISSGTCITCHQVASQVPQAPSIPHDLERRTECLKCHGPDKLKPAPVSHAKFTAATCFLCHERGAERDD